jgi:release factor glutamine methyltransferase
MPEVWTIGKILKWSKDYLTDKNCPSARLDAEVLIADALNCDRINLYTSFDKPLSDSERTGVRERLLRRAEHEPVAHIVGTKEFFGRSFIVNKSTLIPRPDTELLVEKVSELLSTRDESSPLRVLDVGAGCGCIGLTLAAECPSIQVDLVEVDSEAVKLIHNNVERLGLKNINQIHCADIFQMQIPFGEYDIIVSNPPYIDHKDQGEMSREVLDFEPKNALFAEDSGLHFYRFFAENFSSPLKPNGYLFVEMGYRQKDDVAGIFSSSDVWRVCSTFSDLGGHERVAKIQKV